jgi:hypothetical protein
MKRKGQVKSVMRLNTEAEGLEMVRRNDIYAYR